MQHIPANILETNRMSIMKTSQENECCTYTTEQYLTIKMFKKNNSCGKSLWYNVSFLKVGDIHWLYILLTPYDLFLQKEKHRND